MLGVLVGLLVGVALVAVAYLAFSTLRKWFRENTQVDKDNVRAVFQEALANGDYKVVQCGFNRRTRQVTAVKGYRASQRDRELIDKGSCAIIREEC